MTTAETLSERDQPAATLAGDAPPVAPTSRRIQWLDCGRGIAAILVVYNHVCMGLWTAGLPFWPDPYGATSLVLRDVRLPVLLFISGLFVIRSVRRPAAQFVRRRASTLLYPYVVWYLIQTTVLLFWPHAANFHPQRGWRLFPDMFYQPYGQFWFLPALFLANVLFLSFQRLRLPPLTIFALGLLIAALGSRITASEFQIPAKTFQSFPYLAAGALLSQWVIQRGETIRTIFAFAAALALCAATVMVGAFALHREWVQYLLLTPIASSAVLLLALCLARSIASSPLAYLGRHSLEILVTHILGTASARFLLVTVIGTKAMIPHLLAGTAGGLLVPVILVWATRRYHCEFLFRPGVPFVSRRSDRLLRVGNASHPS